MVENTSSTTLVTINGDDVSATFNGSGVTSGENALKDDDKVWGMPQFNENFGENLTDAEYLETVNACIVWYLNQITCSKYLF